MADLKQALDLDPDLFARVERRFEVWSQVTERLLSENASLRKQLDAACLGWI